VPTENGNHQAMDTWCGHTVNGIVWYCSEKCMSIGKEGKPLTYIPTDDEPIMND
jgi:hypothetical protein